MNYTELCNNKMQYNISFAFDCGMLVPDLVYLGTLEPDQREEIFYSPAWDMVSMEMALAKIEGVPVVASAFWDGEEFSYYTLSSQDRHLLTGGQGEELNANLITLWSGQIDLLNKYFKKIGTTLKEKDPEFIGFVNLDTVLQKNKAYYRRLTFGATNDFIFCMTKLHDKDREILTDGSDKNPEGYGASVRVHPYPYDQAINHELIEALRLDLPGCLEKCEECYVLSRKGDTIKKAWKEVYNNLRGLERFGVCYRTDGGVQARRTFNDLKRRRYV